MAAECSNAVPPEFTDRFEICQPLETWRHWTAVLDATLSGTKEVSIGHLQAIAKRTQDEHSICLLVWLIQTTCRIANAPMPSPAPVTHEQPVLIRSLRRLVYLKAGMMTSLVAPELFKVMLQPLRLGITDSWPISLGSFILPVPAFHKEHWSKSGRLSSNYANVAWWLQPQGHAHLSSQQSSSKHA